MDKKKLISVQILNAFVDNDKGGNPAGVVLAADGLTDKNKLAIAQRVGLSETAFVSNSQTADFKLDFFTPNKQIAHCGHATVATFSYLKQMGIVKGNNSSKETIDGNRNISLKGNLAFMEQSKPNYKDVDHWETSILTSLGIKEADLIPNAPIKLVNTGNSFILIPVKSTAVLKSIKPNHSLISQISEAFNLIGFYVFSTEVENKQRDATTRMFGPRYNIFEESGTGMAAGPLVCYLFDILKIKKKSFLIQQGKYMEIPSPSLIMVDLTIENDTIEGLMAGGKGMLKVKREIEISI